MYFYYTNPYPYPRIPLYPCCPPSAYPPSLTQTPPPDMYIQNYEVLKQEIHRSIENRITGPFSGEDIATVTAEFLVGVLLENEEFNKTLYKYKSLSWSPSTNIETRIILILRIVDQLEEIYPDKIQRVSIVSLGSGMLLQEYLLLRALHFRGFTNINLSTVDTVTNYLDNLHLVLLEDDLEDLVTLAYYHSSFQFIIDKTQQPDYKTDICYMTSYQTITFIDPSRDKVAEGVENRSNNLVKFIYREGATLKPIELYTPYNTDQSFIQADSTLEDSIVQDLISTLNHEISSHKFPQGVGNTIRKLPSSPFQFITGTDSIWISFFDIIKMTGHLQTLGYATLGDTIDEFLLIGDFFYWELIPQKKPMALWLFDSSMQQFVQLS